MHENQAFPLAFLDDFAVFGIHIEILMHFLIVNMNKLDLIRFLPYPRKIVFCQFSRFAVVV